MPFRVSHVTFPHLFTLYHLFLNQLTWYYCVYIVLMCSPECASSECINVYIGCALSDVETFMSIQLPSTSTHSNGLRVFLLSCMQSSTETTIAMDGALTQRTRLEEAHSGMDEILSIGRESLTGIRSQ